MIPRIIHQVYVGGQPPEELAALMKGVREMNPNFEYRLWTDNNIAELGYKLEFADLAGDSNALRLLAVERHGGIYLDADFRAIKPMDDLLNHRAWVPEMINGHYCIAAFGAEPGHPWVTWQLEKIRHHLNEPAGAMTVVSDVAPMDGVDVLPVDTFYPYDWVATKAQKIITTNTYAEHLWARSWWSESDYKAVALPEVGGWFDFEEVYNILADECPSGELIAEVGTWLGKSAIYLGQRVKALKKNIGIICVDKWPNAYDQVVSGDAYGQFIANCRHYKVTDVLMPLQHDSSHAASLFPDKTFFAVFIDADHSYEGVKKDILAWTSKVRSGGIICGHDYGAHYPGVPKAVHESFGGEIKVIGAVWIHRMP